MSRVLVTGAGGFIGTSALRPLLDAGHDVYALTREDVAARPRQPGVVWHRHDLLASTGPEELLARLQPELLLHLAWYAEHGLFWSSIENVRWVEATLRLLRAFVSAGGRRAVLTGTCAEYEWTAQGGVLAERTTPSRPSTLYGISKAATLSVCEALAGVTPLELAWGRVFFLYGPGEPATRLVPAVARAVLSGRAAEVGDGSQVRDFLHVEDVGGALAALLDSDVQGPVNLGSGLGVTLREVIETVATAAGDPELVRFGALAPRSGEPQKLVADVRRLHEEVGFAPRVELAEGLERTVAWLRERS